MFIMTTVVGAMSISLAVSLMAPKLKVFKASSRPIKKGRGDGKKSYFVKEYVELMRIGPDGDFIAVTIRYVDRNNFSFITYLSQLASDESSQRGYEDWNMRQGVQPYYQ